MQLRGEEKRKKTGGRRKNSLDQFPLANTITWLPGSSASCWQPSSAPASRAQLPAAPKAPPEWDRLAGVRNSVPLGQGLLGLACQGGPRPCCSPVHPPLQLALSQLAPTSLPLLRGSCPAGLPSGSFLLHMGAGCETEAQALESDRAASAYSFIHSFIRYPTECSVSSTAHDKRWM